MMNSICLENGELSLQELIRFGATGTGTPSWDAGTLGGRYNGDRNGVMIGCNLY